MSSRAVGPDAKGSEEERFRRVDRLRKSREFQRVAREGRRRSSRIFVVLAVPARGAGRLGVTVSRKVGNAVVRNRVKRRIREWFRRGGRDRSDGGDMVVIARRDAARLGGREVAEELDRLCGRNAERRR